ncbi:hypothetical protein FGIG_06458 [Fasciola gigantica]|uniref:Uncharacterized protein n=1 Tax=Fasciola gigantica TaxID=46835 RepID=A0A504YE56_FASGI|nr:hypothetical protein FGIG_06458 [Fasciola gigantica]
MHRPSPVVLIVFENLRVLRSHWINLFHLYGFPSCSLKKRLNSFQDVLNHSRQLELENANLHQECADHKQKIEQLSGKLNEIKDRRMVCTEVETLRSKLRDVEAQLAQQLLERENAEKDARRQQELYSQLKLQQTVQEKRRARNARYPSTGVESKTLGSQVRLGALHSGDEIECEDITLTRAGSKDSVGSTSISSKVKVDSVPLRDGENLGSVLQSELRAAQEESSRLKNQLEETSVRLQKREWEINQLTERVQQLTVDLTSSSTQCEFTEQAAEQARATLTELKTDLSTLEGRLIWARTMNEKSINAMRQSVSADLITRLENTGIFDRLKGIGTGLPDSLNQLCQLFTSNLDDVWALIVDQLSSLQSTMTELRSTADYLRTALNQKEEELSRVTNQLHDQSKHHAQELAAEQCELLDVKRQFETLKQTQCAGSQMVNDLQKQVDALMHEKQQLNKDLNRIKEQSAREMGQSKEMLERATQRLRELEEQLEVWNNRGAIDVAIQTDTIQGELPLPVDVSPLTDSLCRSDVEENERHEADDDPSVVEVQAQVAYEALAADRRGLSDELVRLHDELAESHVDRCELKQQVADLQQKLARKEVELQRQVALYSRAQEQWLLSEREALDTRNQLAQLRTDYASKLQALRAELLPHIDRSRSEASATASHIEAVRIKYEAERDDLKNKLNKATRDLDRLEVDRSRLIELNTSLQHELTATRRWTQDMKLDLSNHMCRTSPMHERQQVARAFESILRNQRTPLEDWLEEVTANNSNHRHRNRSPRGRKADAYDGTELSDSLSGSSSRARELEGEEDPRLIVTDTQLVNHKQRPDSSQYSRRSIDGKPGLYSRPPKQFRSRTNRRKPKRQMEEIVRQIERLTSTTAELDAKACTIQQNMNMHLQRAAAPIASSTLCAMPCAQQQQQPYIVATNDPSKAHSVSLNGPLINGLDQSNAATENPISAPVHFPSDPQHHGMPAVQSYDLDTDADSSAFTDLSQVSSASRHGHPNIDQASSSSPHQQSPPYSMDLSQISVPHRSDSAYSSRQTRTTQPPQSLNLFTGMSQRGGEPNLKKPTATKASPIEPDPHRIAELNRRNRLQPMHLRTSYPVETQTVNPEKVASALRQLSSKTLGKEDPGCFRKPNGSVLLTTVPEEYGNVLREMGDDNIVNNPSSTRHSDPSTARLDSHGPKSGSQSERSEGTARSVRLAAGYRPVPKHLNSITDALIAASDDPSSMAAALETELARAALIGSKEETSQQSQNSAVAQSPPTVSIRSSRGSVHSDKQSSSIAFEILMEPASSKPRRLPAPRANSSDIVRRVPGSRGATTLPAPPLSQIGEGPFSSAKLPLASTLPTPLQRNSKVR